MNNHGLRRTGAAAATASVKDIAIAHAAAPYIATYPWSSSGFGTKYADPFPTPTGNATSVAFSPSGTAIAVAHTTTPFISAYPWTGSAFGTKYANPTTVPSDTGRSISFASY